MTKIYGSSDDLIELEGEITHEIGMYNSGQITFTCSDGTKGTIEFTGSWDICVLNSGRLFHTIITSIGEDGEHEDELAKGCTSYSDVLVLDDGIKWIKINGCKYKS